MVEDVRITIGDTRAGRASLGLCDVVKLDTGPGLDIVGKLRRARFECWVGIAGVITD